MHVRWTPSAAADLESISHYLTSNHPELAHPTVSRLYDAVVSLKRMPYRGRPGREEGTREMVVHDLPYLIGYRIKNDAIEILRIWHGSRQA